MMLPACGDWPLHVLAGIAYGVILLDGEGHRHGATINRAFRLSVREVGVCALKGFIGFHRAFELRDADMNHLATEV